MRRLAVVLAGLVVLIAVALAGSSGVGRRLEQRAIDTRLHVRGGHDAKGLAIVAIDDVTFNDLRTQWPLRRSLHAGVIDRLRAAGVRQIVYDVQFTEPSRRPRDDLALFDAVRRARGTVLATGESDPQGRTNVLGGDANLARIGARAAAADLPSEPGGIVRRYRAKAGPLATLASVVAGRLGQPVAPDRFRDGAALIDFAGPAGTVDTYSFSKVLDGEVPDAALRDRIVVVGATSPTLQDLHPTSAGGRRLMSGPELQANAIATALDGNPLQEAPGWTRFALTLLLGGLGVLLVAALGPVRGAAGAVLVALLAAGGSQLVFDGGLVLPIAVPLIGLAAATVAAVLAAVSQESAERRRVSGRNAELEEAVRARTAELELTHLEAVERLARAAELRDGDTGEHLERMSALCEQVALRLGQPPEAAKLLRQAAILHDVGKIGLPDRILRKPGRLTPEEVEVMRRHTSEGALLLESSRSPLMRMAELIAATHHERWDGTGYPHGLEADEIPVVGRIAAVCDVYDALITARPYKRAWSEAEALAEIRAQRGRHFDPEVADVLLEIVGSAREGDAAPGDGAAAARAERNGANPDTAGTAAGANPDTGDAVAVGDDPPAVDPRPAKPLP
jgi:CHASE2 domain-containing sensor protein